jgi:hypothetical protein
MQIKVGPIRYDVKEVPDLHETRGENDTKISFYGRLDRIRGVISLEADQHPNVKVVTLMHEVVHCILDGAGIKDQPESEIDVLAFGMVSLIQDNPEFVDAVRRGNLRDIKKEIFDSVREFKSAKEALRDL